MSMEHVEGATELMLQLEKLKTNVAKRVLRNGLAAGARIVAKGIKAQITKGRVRKRRRKTDDPKKRQHDRRKFAKTVGYTVAKDRAGAVAAKAGVRVGAGKKAVNATNWYGFLLALGTRRRFRRKSKSVVAATVRMYDPTKKRKYRAWAASVSTFNTGKITAEPWVRDGYAETESAAKDAITKRIGEGVVREVAKGNGS